jgi:hypothetical protein
VWPEFEIETPAGVVACEPQNLLRNPRSIIFLLILVGWLFVIDSFVSFRREEDLREKAASHHHIIDSFLRTQSLSCLDQRISFSHPLVSFYSKSESQKKRNSIAS